MGEHPRLVTGRARRRPEFSTAIAVVAPVAVGFVVLALARATLLPGVAFWDTGELQVVAPLFGVAHPTGYPAYVILGWLASVALQPLGDPAFRMNLLSGLLVALAAALSVVLIRQLTRRMLIAVAGGLVFGTAPEVWTIATHADVHALHIALVALLLILLVAWEDRRSSGSASADRWLLAAAIVFGVALGNHLLVVLLAPGIAAFITIAEPGIWQRRQFVTRCGLAMLATAAALYLELPIRGGLWPAPLVYGQPATPVGFLSIVLGAQFTGGLNPVGHPADRWADLVALASHEFGWLAWFVPPAFIVSAVRRPAYAILTGSGVLLTIWFAGSYTNAEIVRYYLVPELVAVTWLAIATAWLAEAAGRLVARVAERIVAGGRQEGSQRAEPATARSGAIAAPLAAAVLAALLVAPAAADLPARWQLVDEHSDTTAQRWLDGVFASLEPNAVVVSWWSYSTTLWYGQYIEGLRRDVFVVDDRTRLDLNLGEPVDVIDHYLGVRPVYLLRLDNEGVDALARAFVLSSTDTSTGQPLVRVVGRRTAGTAVIP